VVALTARGLLAIWGSTRLRLQRWTALATCLALTACVVQSARAAGYFESEETLWSSQIAAFPDHLKAIDALAESRLARGQRHASRTLFERGLVRATQVHQRGWVLHNLGHLALFEASGVPPWDPGQHNGKVHCEELFASGRLAYSREPLRVATHVSRRELAAWLNADPSFVLLPCARILVAAQAPEHASVLARRALAVAPTDLGARELLAVALARAGRFDDALTALRAPELAGAHAALAPLAQRIEAAQQLLATDLSTDPSRSALMRARAALVLGDTTTARTALAPLLGPRGDHGHEAVHLVAQSYVNEGRFELAEQTLQAAARLAPADPYWAGALEGLAEARSADAEKRAH
jgi:Flp pilus assembly protein TadD